MKAPLFSRSHTSRRPLICNRDMVVDLPVLTSVPQKRMVSVGAFPLAVGPSVSVGDEVIRRSGRSSEAGNVVVAPRYGAGHAGRPL